MTSIKLGIAPTRRSIFSAPDAVKYRGLTEKRLRELGVSFVDINDINEEGLLYNENDRLRILEKFRAEKVDGLFLPHCNFGTEYLCARLAKDLGVPVLLWGPLDERPEPDGTRLRDTQCGLFATGKVLRRFRVPFTYLTNCRLSDPAFERGIKDFLAVCNVVKTFRNIRILQIGPRPFDFWSTMCNEGELLERFNIQLSPIPLPELTAEVKRAIAEGSAVQQTMAYCREHMDINVNEEQFTNIAGLLEYGRNSRAASSKRRQNHAVRQRSGSGFHYRRFGGRRRCVEPLGAARGYGVRGRRGDAAGLRFRRAQHRGILSKPCMAHL